MCCLASNERRFNTFKSVYRSWREILHVWKKKKKLGAVQSPARLNQNVPLFLQWRRPKSYTYNPMAILNILAQGPISTLNHLINTFIFFISGQWTAPGSLFITPVYLMSLWWFAWAGGGGTKEPVTTQGAPEAGREVGLMYSFSSQSDDGFSPLDATDACRDLIIYRQHKAWWDYLDFFHLWFISWFSRF